MKLSPLSALTAALILPFLGAHASAADDNLIMNGGFEAGNQYWKGDGKVERLPDGSRVCEIEAARNRRKDITQEFRMKDSTQVEIVFRARSLNYSGPNLRISIHQIGSGSTFWERPLPEDGSWKNFRVVYTRPNKEERRELIIATQLGTGQVQIDDVEVRAPGTAVADTAPDEPTPPSRPSTPTPLVPPRATPTPATPAVSTKPLATPPPVAKLMKPEPKAPAVSDAPGSFPPKHREMAEDLMKNVWEWKASGGNYHGTVVFEANGLGNEGQKTTGDWRFTEDGTLVYLRGDDRSLVWHLKRIDADHFEGEGHGGAALNRTCSLTRSKPR